MKLFLATGVLFVALLLTAAILLQKTEFSNGGAYSWKYKITVTVYTPEGEVSGSAVRKMVAQNKKSFIAEVGNSAGLYGEAVKIDLGARGVLFALISHDSDNRFRNAFPLPGSKIGQGGATLEGIKYHASLQVGRKAIMDSKRYPGHPRLVMFADLMRPETITLVQDWRREDNGSLYLYEDNMQKLLGQGVSLKDIVLEVSDEPVTWGEVDVILPWLHGLKGGYLHGGKTEKGAPLGVHAGNFKRDFKK